MKKYAPRKVFILENGEYIEISYEELCHREENDPSYKDKFFIPLHGMIMEVDETAYRDFYKAKDRDEYLTWRTRHKDISYSQFDDDECSGEDLLVDLNAEITDAVIWKITVDKLRLIISMLPEDEQELIHALFFRGLSERKWSEECGIPQRTINDRKHRILAKLKKMLEN